jgi:hypothetical protein
MKESEPMTAQEWIERTTWREWAHSSERIAAPITCWLVGRAGIAIGEARELADRIA